MITHVHFREPIAFFAVTRLNNHLLASDTSARAEMVDNRCVRLDNFVPKDRELVDKVLQTYEGEFTLD